MISLPVVEVVVFVVVVVAAVVVVVIVCLIFHLVILIDLRRECFGGQELPESESTQNSVEGGGQMLFSQTPSSPTRGGTSTKQYSAYMLVYERVLFRAGSGSRKVSRVNGSNDEPEKIPDKECVDNKGIDRDNANENEERSYVEINTSCSEVTMPVAVPTVRSNTESKSEPEPEPKPSARSELALPQTLSLNNKDKERGSSESKSRSRSKRVNLSTAPGSGFAKMAPRVMQAVNLENADFVRDKNMISK